MNSPIMGYSVIILFAIMMTAITLFINKKDVNQNVDDLLTAGRRVPFGLVAASVCVAWIWTGTIMASAEAGVWFGINGGFNYAWGAVVPFMIFIPIALPAPTASLIIGLWSGRLNPKVSLLSIVVGLASGLAAYFMIANDDLNWFVGNMLSLFLPFLIILISLPFTNKMYDFNKLKNYQPEHKINL